jgi:hypothetical protein
VLSFLLSDIKSEAILRRKKLFYPHGDHWVLENWYYSITSWTANHKGKCNTNGNFSWIRGFWFSMGFWKAFVVWYRIVLKWIRMESWEERYGRGGG